MTTNAFPRIGVLFVCTGNQCRSPIAAALLRARLDERGSPLETMWAVGVDLSGHRSRPLSPTTIGAADLIVGMTRQHVVELTVMAPPEWERAFTFADLLRRAETVGPRQRIEAAFGEAHQLELAVAVGEIGEHEEGEPIVDRLVEGP